MGHRFSVSELGALLEAAEKEVPQGTVWRHYRDNQGAKPYTVVGHAIAEESEVVVVLYQSLEGVTFSRPLTEFCETVRGGTQKRFQKIS
jgi:hypothetical protein